MSDKELNFNSIKVRLEQLALANLRDLNKFQFHKGTIRTHRGEVSLVGEVDFNSIKVRLELRMWCPAAGRTKISIP